MLFVSMATYNTPRSLVDRAVKSVLGQTHRDLRLVLVNDGGPPLHGLVRDKRLVVVNLPENRGRYFADAVVTEAIADRPDALWSVHDSDDWSEPHRFERLLPHMKDGAVVSSYWRHRNGQKHMVQQPARVQIDRPKRGFAHLAHWCSGVYTSERVRRAGGIHPGFLVGFDTLFVRMLVMTGQVGVVDQPDYHWCRRQSGSLTTAPKTRFGSKLRVDTKKVLSRLDDLAWDAGTNRGEVIRSDVDPLLAEQVSYHALRLNNRLAA